MGKRQKAIPDGWLDYCNINDVIRDARIIPMKVPLPYHKFIDETLHRFQWTPRDVLQAIPNLGLVIDITNKFPAYYNTSEFMENGIDYVKIPCVGHHVPNDEVYKRFCEVLEIFYERNQTNERIVAIHCTHGVNRTGYLICKFLVEKFRYSPEEALTIFAAKRGHALERENYIEVINNL